MPLRVYNTLTRQKEPFPKRPPAEVGIYLCGPTVYKPSHIGHMVGPVIFDAVKRYLTYLGFRVTWVVNITDVDDKLIARAKELGTTVKDLAERMTADYLAGLKKLNVSGVDQMPRATEHIPGMVAMIQGLIDKGYAYAAGGDVYFDITKDDDYGKLCNRDPEQLEAGARIEVSDKKRSPGDFALWKGAKPDEPADVQFDSPWGKGRPGWHIECSAMSMKYLGETLDIHGGGLDLQFPHHENELAQSESFTGKPFARVWMHNGLLKMGHAKMAGSVGNVVNVADLLAKHHPETVRFLLLATHYRSPIEYSDERLEETEDALEGFYRLFKEIERVTGGSNFYELSVEAFNYSWKPNSPRFGTWSQDELIEAVIPRMENEFLTFMDDDFNTGGAIGVLFKLKTYLNRFSTVADFINTGDQNDKWNFLKGVLVFKKLSGILGLFWEPVNTKFGRAVHGSADITLGPVRLSATGTLASKEQQLIEKLMDLLIDLRAETRKAKNFALADQIRKRLTELNVTLEDRPGGKTDWRLG